MTDGAQTYREYDPPSGCFVEKFQVNHSDGEYTKPVDMIRDVESRERMTVLAGTQTLDHEWSGLKAELPRSTSAKTQEQKEILDEYIRAAQWRRLVNTGDLWEAFCKAAQRHAQQQV
eukprot:9895405-Karenia_brevis.AAC.1